jgi:hypothetical protein
MRNLATIQTIKSLDKIEGKDRILYASFESVGFRVIVKADMKIGQKVVYCEVDSLLPVKEEYDFLRKSCFSEKWNGFRIRNMRLAGLYSEGLTLSVPVGLEGKEDGYDVTELLEIRKYDPEALAEQVLSERNKANWAKRLAYKYPFWKKIVNFFFPKERNSWPKWASKSDETRAQNLSYIFEQYQGEQFYSSEKVDGQSCLYGMVKGKFYVCSRNFMVVPVGGGAQTNYWQFAKINDVENRLKKMREDIGFDFYLQGELCGPTIQGNKYRFKALRFLVFNMRDVTTGKYLPENQMHLTCAKYGFEYVPVLEYFTWAFKDMDELLKYADGKSVFGDNVLREGVVLRSLVVAPPDQGQANMRSLKVISPSFDLKWNK